MLSLFTKFIELFNSNNNNSSITQTVNRKFDTITQEIPSLKAGRAFALNRALLCRLYY